MTDLALERMKAAGTKRRAELEMLREDILNAAKQSQCHFARLPVEIQTEIFLLVINGSNSRMLALNLVCRYWRNLILDTPKFWRRLVLGSESPQKMVDAWLGRANGVLTSLRIESGFKFSKKRNVLKKASPDLWSRLEELEVDASTFEILLPETIPQLRLRKFVLGSESSFLQIDLWKRLQRLQTPTTRHFALRVNEGDAMLLDKIPFCGLTTLELSGVFNYDHFFELVRRNPLLEVLIITHPRHWSVSPPPVEPVSLLHLRRIELNDLSTPGVFLRFLRTPNLAAFKVHGNDTRSDIPCLQVILSQNITSLTEIDLCFCKLSSPALIDLLQKSNQLETFRLSQCLFLADDDNVNIVIEALCKGTSDDGDDSSASIICPRLQHLEVSRMPQLKAGPLVRLVKAHLTTSETPLPDGPSSSSSLLPSGRGQDHSLPLPILSLNIRNCDSIDSMSLQWLRARVPTVLGGMSFKEKQRRVTRQ